MIRNGKSSLNDVWRLGNSDRAGHQRCLTSCWALLKKSASGVFVPLLSGVDVSGFSLSWCTGRRVYPTGHIFFVSSAILAAASCRPSFDLFCVVPDFGTEIVLCSLVSRSYASFSWWVPIHCFQVETLISVFGGYTVNMERWEELFNPPYFPTP